MSSNKTHRAKRLKVLRAFSLLICLVCFLVAGASMLMLPEQASVQLRQSRFEVASCFLIAGVVSLVILLIFHNKYKEVEMYDN